MSFAKNNKTFKITYFAIPATVTGVEVFFLPSFPTIAENR